MLCSILINSDCITKFMISICMEVLDSTAEKGYRRYSSIDLLQGAPHMTGCDAQLHAVCSGWVSVADGVGMYML